ncbi:MAG: tryptophan-rich sensory protein [Candidatus Nanoarchaeia archaeon]|nr:tryptophan-rich sensory protein [Candidatus Nanoarchaeia archaeon]MDD5054613.1 tryptophan-rich sensory protein [Candidatus Nanoarchaeia archaeon]MDD5499577.1 tryptophan-rich sensory protein [Candidatus Nanoarchaeia archaeon]
MKKTAKINKKLLIYSFATVFAFAAIGSFFTSSGINSWYGEMNKPAITPPNWFFPIIWTSLYALMGISLYWIFDKGIKKNFLAIALFIIQLFLNALWCFLFFGLKEFLFGLICIVFLWFAILASAIEFMRIDKRSAYLLFPYLAWVLLATILNFMFILANP